jgi:hypothetical protein
MRPRHVPKNDPLRRQIATQWALLAAGLVACTSAPIAQFHGAAAPSAIAADDLQQHDYVPHDHLTIGSVAAKCQHDTGDADEGDRCSELTLLRTMREVAARSGGTAFIAPSCRYETVSSSVQRIQCTATVARRRALLPATATASDASAAQERRWDVRIEGRAIRITARPGPGVEPQPHSQRVRRAWTEDGSAKQLGTVKAECVERCERALVERGLEQGAAWIGSEELAQVRCVEIQADRWSCTGNAVSK